MANLKKAVVDFGKLHVEVEQRQPNTSEYLPAFVASKEFKTAFTFISNTDIGKYQYSDSVWDYYQNPANGVQSRILVSIVRR